jgi:hypothetical protein
VAGADGWHASSLEDESSLPGSWDSQAIACEVDRKQGTRSDSQIVDRHSDRSDVNPCQDMGISGVGEGMINISPIRKSTNKDRYIVVRVAPRITPRPGPEENDVRYPIR